MVVKNPAPLEQNPIGENKKLSDPWAWWAQKQDEILSINTTNITTNTAAIAALDTDIETGFNFAGDTGTGSVSTEQTFSLLGTSLEVETSASGQTITIGLPDDVTITSDLIVGDTLAVGSTSTDDVANIFGTLNTAGTIALNHGQLRVGNTSIIGQVRIGYDDSEDYGFISAGREGVGWDDLILQAGGGNIGVGTSSPSSIVEVAEASGPTVTLKTTSTTIGNGGLIGEVDFFGSDSSTSAAGIVGRIGVFAEGAHGNNDAKTSMRFNTNAGNAGTLAESMRIDSRGRLGVGTGSDVHGVITTEQTGNVFDDLGDADDYALSIHCSSTTGEGNGIAFAAATNASVGAAIVVIDQGTNNVSDLAFYTKSSTTNGAAPVERMRILKTGELGLGTSAPGDLLHIFKATSGETANADAQVIIENSGSTGIQFLSGATSKSTIFFSDSSDDDAFVVEVDHNLEKMNIKADSETASLSIFFNGGVTLEDSLLIADGASGATADSTASTLVVGGNTTPGISVLGTDTTKETIIWGSAGDATGAKAEWDYGTSGANKLLTFGTTVASGEISVISGNSVEAMRINSSGFLGIGDADPPRPLTVLNDVNPVVRIETTLTTKSPCVSFIKSGATGLIGMQSTSQALVASGDDNALVINNQSAFSMHLCTNGVIRQTITSAGITEFKEALVLFNRTDANRGSAGTAGRIIFNTDDGQMNVDDGTNWTLPDGTTT